MSPGRLSAPTWHELHVLGQTRTESAWSQRPRERTSVHESSVPRSSSSEVNVLTISCSSFASTSSQEFFSALFADGPPAPFVADVVATSWVLESAAASGTASSATTPRTSLSPLAATQATRSKRGSTLTRTRILGLSQMRLSEVPATTEEAKGRSRLLPTWAAICDCSATCIPQCWTFEITRSPPSLEIPGFVCFHPLAIIQWTPSSERRELYGVSRS